MKLCSLFAAVLLCASANAQQDGNIVVNTHNSINCVTEKGEQGFAASTWTIGGTVTSGKPSSGAPVVSKPSLADLVITKKFDACSAQLIHAFLRGDSLPMKKLTLIQYSAAKSDAAPIPLVTVVLTDPLINSYTVSGAVDVNPVETLAFAYRSLCITSVSQAPDGKASNPVTVCYDLALNKVS